MYSPDLSVNVVDDEKWWSDEYNMFDYGKPYDFNVPFFTQFQSLLQVVPLPHLQRAYSTFENSDYCNAAAGLKNCYLVTNADDCEDCYYGFYIEDSKDCVDIMFSNKSELCYDSMHLDQCFNCRHCEDCSACSDIVYCKDCVNCKNCFGCIGLRHKSYYIFNKAYSKKEYEEKISELRLHSYESLTEVHNVVKKSFEKFPHKLFHGRNVENGHGDYLYNVKDVSHSYLVRNAESCKYTQFLQVLSTGTFNAYDYTMFGVGADLMYEDAWCGLGVHNLKFCIWNYGASDMEYCIGCHYSSNLFGCIGLRHSQFCIFNKQYTEDEYREILPRIKQQMMDVPYIDSNGIEYRYGEFFPTELSPFHYNQTFAQDFVPLLKEDAINSGFGWYSKDQEQPSASHTISWKDLPDSAADADDNLVNAQIQCKAYTENQKDAANHNCTKNFKITTAELDFYKRNNIPLPRYCFNTRHYQKLRRINPFNLWNRQCAKCSKDIQTTYSPERPEIVYCEECYLAEVY